MALSPTAALAHAKLVASTPAANAKVAKVTSIQLKFSEKLVASTVKAELVMTGMPGMADHPPMKIAIGMGIAATAYLFLMFFSFALPDKAALAGMKADQVQSILVTPWVMVGLYFILTVAELFISPLGLAFVSKVAPPHMQGLMQGFWLAATAVGNALLFVGGWLYMHTPMWATWCVFVAACGMSMLVMLSMVRWLERVTK